LVLILLSRYYMFFHYIFYAHYLTICPHAYVYRGMGVLWKIRRPVASVLNFY
jgi:hypothetical protein